MSARRSVILFWQLLILVLLLAVWQWGFEWSKAVLPRTTCRRFSIHFIAKPSTIWDSFRGSAVSSTWRLCRLPAQRRQQSLVCHAGDAENTWWGFLFGSASGVAAGLVLGRSILLARIVGPYIVALNSIRASRSCR